MYRYRPNGAYKLLVHLLYGQYADMEIMPRGIIQLHSVRKLSRRLGTQSSTLNRWFLWLEEHGYLESMIYSPDRRSVKFRMRPPSNFAFQSSSEVQSGRF